MVTIIPNFALEGSSMLYCIGVGGRGTVPVPCNTSSSPSALLPQPWRSLEVHATAQLVLPLLKQLAAPAVLANAGQLWAVPAQHASQCSPVAGDHAAPAAQVPDTGAGLDERRAVARCAVGKRYSEVLMTRMKKAMPGRESRA